MVNLCLSVINIGVLFFLGVEILYNRRDSRGEFTAETDIDVYI